jgi:hypothetical protein
MYVRYSDTVVGRYRPSRRVPVSCFARVDLLGIVLLAGVGVYSLETSKERLVRTVDQFEEAVLQYLCAPPERLVNTWVEIPFDGSQGGCCPDFFVCDFSDSTVYVVEVTSASNAWKAFGYRVEEREKRWFGPLRNRLATLSPIFQSWDYHVTLCVRNEQLAKVRERASALPDVSVISLDDVVFPWRWQWDGARPKNVLRDANKLARVHASPPNLSAAGV